MMAVEMVGVCFMLLFALYILSTFDFLHEHSAKKGYKNNENASKINKSRQFRQFVSRISYIDLLLYTISSAYRLSSNDNDI